jgi:hypothetical protein
MRRDETIGEKVTAGQVGRGLDAPLLLHGGYFSPYLIQVNGRQHPETFLLLAQGAEQVGRTHIRGPGGDANPDAAPVLPMPLAVQSLDTCQALFGQSAIDFKRTGLANPGMGTVPGSFAELQPQAASRQGLGITVDANRIFQQQGSATANRFDGAEQAHRAMFLIAELG